MRLQVPARPERPGAEPAQVDHSSVDAWRESPGSGGIQSVVQAERKERARLSGLDSLAARLRSVKLSGGAGKWRSQPFLEQPVTPRLIARCV